MVLLVITSFSFSNQKEIPKKESEFLSEKKGLDEYDIIFFHPKIQGSQILENLVKKINSSNIYLGFQGKISEMGKDFYKEYLSEKKDVIYLEKLSQEMEVLEIN